MDAHCFRRQFVVTDGQDRIADPGVHQIADSQRREDDQNQHEEIDSERCAEHIPENCRLGNRHNAQGASGQAHPVQFDHTDDLALEDLVRH